MLTLFIDLSLKLPSAEQKPELRDSVYSPGHPNRALRSRLTKELLDQFNEIEEMRAKMEESKHKLANAQANAKRVKKANRSSIIPSLGRTSEYKSDGPTSFRSKYGTSSLYKISTDLDSLWSGSYKEPIRYKDRSNSNKPILHTEYKKMKQTRDPDSVMRAQHRERSTEACFRKNESYAGFLMKEREKRAKINEAMRKVGAERMEHDRNHRKFSKSQAENKEKVASWLLNSMPGEVSRPPNFALSLQTILTSNRVCRRRKPDPVLPSERF